MSKYIRIQVSGPFAELDYTVPEKKAATELKRIKALAKTYVEPVKENVKVSSRYRVYSGQRRGYVWRTMRIDFRATDHGVEPTKITLTTV